MASAFFGDSSTHAGNTSSAPPAAARRQCAGGRSPSTTPPSASRQVLTPVQPTTCGQASSATGGRLPSPAQALPWRPPATRRFLWDRTPQGPAIVADLAVSLPLAGMPVLCSLPPSAKSPFQNLNCPFCAPTSQNTRIQVSVQPSAWTLLQRMQQGGSSGTLTLSGRLCAVSEQGLEVELGTGRFWFLLGTFGAASAATGPVYLGRLCSLQVFPNSQS